MRPFALVLAAALAVLLPLRTQAADTVGDCRIGAYRLDDGSLVDIGASTADALRWRKLDGTTGALHRSADGSWASTLGWTERSDGKRVVFPDCATGDIVFDNTRGHRIRFDVTDTLFESTGLKLAGRLVLPEGAGPVPIVVLTHGSERYSGRDFYVLQRLLPAEGIGVFVYDKRGTGGSEGRYTQDFATLADDAAAAMREARRIAGPRAGRVGFQGGSQGGWVAPLAALKAPCDFVIVGFGLAVSPLEEDREEIELEMALKGHSAAETAQALEIARAAGTIMTSDFTRGFDRFDELRARYRDAPWYKDLYGNFTHELLPYSEAELRAKADEFRVGTPWNYDSMAVLRQLKTPQLWLLGADDLAAPSAETRRRLDTLIAQGHRITVALFPRAEHGIYEYETRPNGERVSTRNADGYFAMIRDFARDGRLRAAPYGASVVTLPRAR